MADHARCVGQLIKATAVVCSDGESFTDDFDFPEALTLRIHPDAGDVKRWMDNDHMDPWYFVELVHAPPACQKILNDHKAHVVAVYGPAYHVDGSYEKPEWKVLAPQSAPPGS